MCTRHFKAILFINLLDRGVFRSRPKNNFASCTNAILAGRGKTDPTIGSYEVSLIGSWKSRVPSVGRESQIFSPDLRAFQEIVGVTKVVLLVKIFFFRKGGGGTQHSVV